MPKMTPAEQSMARKLAAAAISKAKPGNIAADRPKEGTDAPYALLRAQLGTHLRELQSTRSISERIVKKLGFLPEYADHVDTVILTSDAEGKALQDEVFVQVLIWTFDAATIEPELYPRAFEMAEHVLKYGLSMPERFNSSAAAYVAESVADDALTKINAAVMAAKAEPQTGPYVAPFDIDRLSEVVKLTEGHDMVDQIRAKVHKATGKLLALLATAIDEKRAEGHTGGGNMARYAALKHFAKSVEYNPATGVKTDVAALNRALSKSTPDA